MTVRVARDVLVGALLIGVLPSTALGDAANATLAQAEQLHRDALVIDGHNDVTTWILDCGFDLGMDGADRAKSNAELWWILGRVLPMPSGDQLRTHTAFAGWRPAVWTPSSSRSSPTRGASPPAKSPRHERSA